MTVVDVFTSLPGETKIFVAVIGALALFFHVKFDEKAITYGPTILTTMGIFATFFGIAVGLASFDADHVTESVPKLLDALKTAFWASVAGVGAALTIKFRHVFIGAPTGEVAGSGADGEVTAADLAALLTNIQKALVGNDESTLVSQLKLTRQDSNDRLDALKKAQLDALQKLSEMSSKTLVEALKDVIRDFNNKITEQFGDNFKALNDAVGKLLVWQENYRLHIEQTTERHNQIVGSMKTASDNYELMVGKSETFTKTAQDLDKLLTSLETQKQQLVTALKFLGDLLTKASGALPEIEGKIVKIAEDLSKSQSENLRLLNSGLAENTLLVRKSIQDVTLDYSKSNQEFNKQMGEMVAKTKEQVAALDKALAEELSKSLEGLGMQLAALSEKFVSDYAPLTDKLKAVVSMARNV